MIEECFVVHIVQCCQQYCSALLHLIQAQKYCSILLTTSKTFFKLVILQIQILPAVYFLFFFNFFSFKAENKDLLINPQYLRFIILEEQSFLN